MSEAHANNSTHLFINGLSIGSGGGYTVARELFREIAALRPTWKVTMGLIKGVALHQEMSGEDLPDNCVFHWAPPTALGRVSRWRYENGELVRWAAVHRVDAVLQLNGMIIPQMHRPVIAHCQDPMPYRSEAWHGWKDRLLFFLKRREQARALRHADCVGFTSAYLRDLICGHHGLTPKRAEVFHNGLPASWIDRATAGLPDWASRPMEIITVSNVTRHKRQDLIVRALGRLIGEPGLEQLKYRIVGDGPADYIAELKALTNELGLSEHVIFEGRVDDDHLRELFAQAKCFCLMSVCESFGIPAIEAMSFGTPVVTSNCCAMPEVCGAAAELVNVDDVDDLTMRLRRTLTEPDRAQAMRREGVEQVQKFSWANTAKRLVEMVDTILGNAS